MTIKKLSAALLAVLLVLSFGGCKSKNEEPDNKPKGARENVIVSENPRTEENRLKPAESESSEEEESSEPEKDTVPDEMSSAFLAAVKSGVRENIQQFTDYNTMFKLAEGQGADWLLRQVLLRLDYEVIAVNTEETKSTATVKLSNLDMTTVLPLYFEQAGAVLYENNSERLGKTQEELDAEYRKIFVDLLTQYDNTRFDKIVEISLEKTGDEWKLQVGPEFGNLALGGFLDAQDKMRGDMQQTAAESQAEASQDTGDGEYGDIDYD